MYLQGKEREVFSMKRVYQKKQYVKINGEKEWQRTGSGCFQYLEESEAKERNFESRVLTDFEEICDVVDKYIINGEVRKTIFGNKVFNLYYPALIVSVTYRHFGIKTFEVKEEYVLREDYNIRTLASELTADDFCAYLKDRGIENLVIS